MIYRILVIVTLISFQRLTFAQYSTQSVLADGQIYKISTSTDGVYRMNYSFLKDQLGVDIDNIDPRNIHLYGNGGGLLPENIDAIEEDDLIENHILIIGEEDGSFDPEDFILFYGQGADQRHWNNGTQKFSKPKNIYADVTTYFLKIANTPGQRIQGAATVSGATYTSSRCDSHFRLEDEKVNLLDDFNGASGTGQSWYGDLFKGLRSRDYDINMANLISGEEGHLKVVFAARSSATSTVQVAVENESYSRLIGSVNLTDNEGRYARVGTIEGDFTIADNSVDVQINYPTNGATSSGWLDYIEINAPSQLNASRAYEPFSDHGSLAHTTSTFLIKDANATTLVWDISNSNQPQAVATVEQNEGLSFSFESETLKTFISYNDGSVNTPMAVGQISNQNLHGLDNLNMAVVYHPDLVDAAELFTSYRSEHSGLDVAMIDVEEIYNEFGSGAPSPIAIRNFAKMLYDRSDNFQYMMLLGDASFDYKNLKNIASPSNLVPTYETKESLDPIRGFPSDDFFALLTTGEGSSLKGALDIAIGRLPAKTSGEAMDMINKIIAYETDPDRLGDWMNKVTFVADDEDFNIHLNQADQIAEKLLGEHPNYNVEKIYLDAFKQVSTAGGELYPDVQTAINNSFFKGTNVINYMGHGGATGFAQERILTINDVSNWNNANKLALLVTATCSFTGYDDPNFVTAGERAILNPNGGAIALFTTVRAVYSSSNERLTKAVFDNLFKPVGGNVPPIGEILRIAKNSNAADTLGINARKFLLIGDPSLMLAMPQYQVNTTEINNQPVLITDTLKALEPVTIKGQVENNGTVLASFNGTVDILIFDKPRSVSTLGQDQTSFATDFNTQKNIIFKGTASVENGVFTYDFVVPKDIDYQFGKGKISYYAKSDAFEDASGYFNDFVVGGTSSNPIQDDNGPEIQIFMNDENFVTGGITGPNPTLIVNLEDDNGINVVGNSIGHDITAVLDNQSNNTIILNEFYKSELDNTKVGTVRFPLNDLEEGPHSIEVKAWDIANNSTSSSIDFVVASDSKSAINQIINYPNPVADQTSFRIDHNISSGLLDITIDIFALNGNLVQSLKYTSGTNSGVIDNLNWNVTSSSGWAIPNGIYLFKVTLEESNNDQGKKIHSKLEKMVILK